MPHVLVPHTLAYWQACAWLLLGLFLSQYRSTTIAPFTVIGTKAAITSGFDAAGNVTGRIWADGRVQTLTWEAQGQLVKVTLRDASNHGYDWSAAYDGKGRRLRTSRQQVVAGAPNGPLSVVT
jgi:YD repeat-containing protein